MKIFFVLGFLFVAFSSVLSLSAHADPTDGGTGIDAWYNRFWGNQEARDAVDTCTFAPMEDASNGGFVNAANLLMCHLKVDLGITGPTADTGITGSYGSSFNHVIVSGSDGGASFSGYDYETQVWGCYNGLQYINGNIVTVNCDSTTDFYPLAYINWTKNAAGTVNRGRLFMDESVLGGGVGPMSMATFCPGINGFCPSPLPTDAPTTYNPDMYINMLWDTGTAASPRQLEFKIAAMFYEPYLLGYNGVNWYGLHRIGSDGIISSAFMQVPASGTAFGRFAAQFDYANFLVNTKADISGSHTAKSDVISPFQYCSSMASNPPDWDYTPGANCSSLPGMSFPALSENDVATFVGLTPQPGPYPNPTPSPIGDFGPMATHPDSL